MFDPHLKSNDLPADRERLDANESRCTAFVSEYTQSYSSLYGFALSLVGVTSAADDIMQEAGLILWQKFDDFAVGTDFAKWARMIVRNLVRNLHRTRRPVYLSFDDDLLEKIAETRVLADEWLEVHQAALEECMKGLNQADRKLISLCYAEDQTVAAAAGELSETSNAVYKRLKRIRCRLFRCVQKRLGLGLESIG